jgi:uncharacterized protein DUF1488
VQADTSPATEPSVRRDRFECDVGEGSSFARGAESLGRNILTFFRHDPQKHVASQVMMATSRL